MDYWAYTDMLVSAVCIYFCCCGRLPVSCAATGRKLCGPTVFSRTRKKFLNLYFSEKRLTMVVAFIYFCFIGANLVILSGVYLSFYHGHGALKYIVGILLCVVLVVLDLWGFHYMFHSAWEMDKITEAVDNLSSGDTSYQIDTSLFSGKRKGSGGEPEQHFPTGMEDVLQEQVKSERLKADLITNVSHDIKTPLTSIINYVDLIKREHIQDPKIQSLLKRAGAEVPAAEEPDGGSGGGVQRPAPAM